jgi:ATP synthase protein I
LHFKAIDRDYDFLTCLGSVSMVRAVLWGGGALFLHSRERRRVSTVMTNDTRDDRGGEKTTGHPPADEAALSARLSQLDTRLSAARRERDLQGGRQGSENQSASARASAMARGFRLSSELVAGVLVGAVIGWGIDRLLSTSPWGLIVFLLLGFAAGVVNLMRAAGVAPGDRSDRR